MKAVVLLNEGAGTLAGLDVSDAQLQIARGFADAGARPTSASSSRAPPRRRARKPRAAAIRRDLRRRRRRNHQHHRQRRRRQRQGVRRPAARHAQPLRQRPENPARPRRGDRRPRAGARSIDLPVAEVNGHVFLNFSAIGLHPEIVMDREAQREEKGRGKWPAMAVAMLRKLKSPPTSRLTLSARGHTIARRTPSVIVCNNPHQMEVFGVKDASVPERGLLNVYVTTRAEAAHAGLADVPRRRRRDRREHQAFRVDGPARAAHRLQPPRAAGLGRRRSDWTCATPLLYRIREKPMRVIVPKEEQSTKSDAEARNEEENSNEEMIQTLASLLYLNFEFVSDFVLRIRILLLVHLENDRPHLRHPLRPHRPRRRRRRASPTCTSKSRRSSS